MTVYVVAIVEGHTETRCIERLLHRIWSGLLLRPERLHVLNVLRKPRTGLVHPNGVLLAEQIEKAAVRLAARLQEEAGSRSLILVALDAERDCPAQLGRALQARATAARSDVAISCVLAKEMFENWIVAGASTLGGILGLPVHIPARTNVEDMNGATWLDQQLRSVRGNAKYEKADFAIHFVQAMNLSEARDNSPSFDKLCRELEKLIPSPPAPEAGAGEPPPPVAEPPTPALPPVP